MSKIGRPRKFDKQVWYNMLIPEDLKGNQEFYKYIRKCRDNYITGKNFTGKKEALVKELYEFMTNKMKITEKMSETDMKLIEKIEEML